jgi:hypothetical protein
MMMSSNTVGNHNFNTTGITSVNVKKTHAKQEEKATLKLTNAKPDSFEYTQPRDTTPEAPATVDTQPQVNNNTMGLIAPIV